MIILHVYLTYGIMWFQDYLSSSPLLFFLYLWYPFSEIECKSDVRMLYNISLSWESHLAIYIGMPDYIHDITAVNIAGRL